MPAKAGRYFLGSAGRVFIRWRDAYQDMVERGLSALKSNPKNLPNQTPALKRREVLVSAAPSILGVYSDRFVIWRAYHGIHIQVGTLIVCLQMQKSAKSGPPFQFTAIRPSRGHCLTCPAGRGCNRFAPSRSPRETYAGANAIESLKHVIRKFIPAFARYGSKESVRRLVWSYANVSTHLTIR